MNPEASQYYRLTDKAYRALVAEQTPFMNLGFWPSDSIVEAQTRLVVETLKFGDSSLSPSDRSALRVLELGPGWGGSRSLIAARWPSAPYVGVNCSVEQIEYATILNQRIPHTQYKHLFFENLEVGDCDSANTAVGIEAVIHVKDKAALFERLAKIGIKRILLAEICPVDRSVFEANSLFDPALKYTRPVEDYETAFLKAGFTQVDSRDISAHVFSGWSESLNQISSDSFSGNHRILRQFKQSYASLASFERQGKVRYMLFSARIS